MQKRTPPQIRISITRRIVVHSVVLTTLTAVTLSISAYVTAWHLMQQRVFAQLASLVNAKEERIMVRLDTDRERTALLTAQVRTAATDSQLRTLMEGMQEEGVPVLGMAVFDAVGRMRLHAGIAPDAPSAAVKATILSASEGIEGWEGYTIYSPVDTQRVLAIRYSLREFLQSLFSVPSLGDTGEVVLAKQENETLLLLNNAYAEGRRSPLRLGAMTDLLAARVPIAEAVAKREAIRSARDYAGNRVFTAYRQLPMLGWGLAVNVQRSEAMRGIGTMAAMLLFKSVLLLLLTGYAAIILAHHLTAPLRHLTDKMKKLGPHHWSLGRTIRTGDEVEVLEYIASDMTKRLKRIYDHMEEEIEERTEELRKQYLKDRTILETIDQGVIMVDAKGLITDANAAALAVLHCEGDQCIERHIEEVFEIRMHKKPLQGVSHPVHHVLKTRQSLRSSPEMHYSIMNADNILIPVLMVVKPLMSDEELVGVIIVFQDITEERRVDYLKSEFISLASHQLRTPLSSLQWYIELMSDEKQLNNEQVEYMKEMETAAKRMSALIDSLLHAARLEGGDITPHANAVELTSLLTELGEELRSMAKEKGISTTIHLPKKQITLQTDSVLLHVVFKNLFSNAVKYTMSGGTVDVAMSATASHITITVSDTGIGIPVKDQKRLFQRLFRADNARKIDTDGNGLGLYITKMIVESLDGAVSAKSTEGKGTAFTIKLPVKPRKTPRKKS